MYACSYCVPCFLSIFALMPFKTMSFPSLKHKVYFSKRIYTRSNGSGASDVFGTFTQISLDGCILECKRRRRCDGVNYVTRAHVCYLVSTRSDNHVNDVTDVGSMYSKKVDWNMAEFSVCNECSLEETCTSGTSATCSITGCGIPPESNKARILGNIYGVTNQVMYICDKSYSASFVSRCLGNGSWSVEHSVCQLLTTTDTPTIQSTALSTIHTTEQLVDSTTTGPELECTEGWTQLSRDCYKVITPGLLPWTTAVQYCEMYLNATLVIIETATKNAFIIELALNHSSPGFWAGLSAHVAPVWKWIDGVELYNSDFHMFDPFPNPSPTQCLYVSTDPNQGWYTEDCGSGKALVCEKRP